MPDEPRDAADVKLPPPLVALAAIGTGFGLRAALPVSVFHGLGGELLPRIIGGCGVALGVATVVTSAVMLKRTGQNPEPWQPTHEIVTSGPFGWSRNPVYVGMLLVVLSVGLIADNLWGVAMVIPAWAILRHFVVLREEAYLERKFGDPYRAYCSTVRRWL